MFQRLKGAIDSRIAEEQARQKALQSSPGSRSSSAARRSSARASSPSKRPGRPRERKDGSAGNEPDPSEFEADFVVGDDDTASGTATPRKEPEKAADENNDEAGADEKALPDVPKDAPAESSPHRMVEELPTEVRVKLRKLDRLESKYQELLRAYRTAHARVQTIEPFEASLRENTPLTSISEPAALAEYLNQLNLKGDMVIDELKRVSTERTDYKHRLDEAEKSTREAWDEVTNLKKQQQQKPEDGGTRASKDLTSSARPSLEVSKPLAREETSEATLKSPTPSVTSRIPSFSIFSPRTTTVTSPPPPKSPPSKGESEDFFSYDNELPRLESAVKERQAEIDGLKHQVQTLKGDLAVTRESTEGMVQSLESATNELHGLRDAKDQHSTERASLERQVSELTSKLSAAEGDAEASRPIIEELKAQLSRYETSTGELNAKIEDLGSQITRLETEKREHVQRIDEVEASESATSKNVELLKEEKDGAIAELNKYKEAPEDKRIETMQRIITSLREQLKDGDTLIQDLKRQLEEGETLEQMNHAEFFEDIDLKLRDDPDWIKSKEMEEGAQYILNKIFSNSKSAVMSEAADAYPIATPSAEATPTVQGKKKNKKKKKSKGGAANAAVPTNGESPIPEPETASQQANGPTNDASDPSGSSEPAKVESILSTLQAKMEGLQSQIQEKDMAIERLHAMVKGEDDLKEEVETLRESLTEMQEHLGAKDKLDKALAEKNALEDTVKGLEKELVELRASQVSGAAAENAHKNLLGEYEDLKIQVTTLRTSLNAAEQLAAARFKELTDLREMLQKAQPELKNLRTEVAELKSARDDLKNKSGELRRLEARHEDLKSEMKGLGIRIGSQDSEAKSMQQKLTQEASARMKAEEALRVAESDLRYSEQRKQEALEGSQQVSKDLQKSKEEAQNTRTKIRELEEQLESLNRATDALKEELQLKTAQYSSAQSLMSSMRDQTSEIGTQMKEARERCESLDEELGESQRMLSERTREGETMRRLLADVETRAEIKVREMKERMEVATEERDRAEDEASTIGRRRAREVEELKTKARDAERALKRLEDDKEELEHAQKDWRRRREDLEATQERSASELQEVRTAMTELRDALDDSERQTRDLEKEKSELRHTLEETQQRLEKLQKANKSLTDEMRSLQATARKPSGRPGLDSGVQSSRSSIDSPTPPQQRLGSVVGSPAPRDRATTPGGGPGGAGAIDYVYLKNVLLQFLEQKDKNHQKQLIPVLGMLLHFDRKDEQKWMSAITSR